MANWGNFKFTDNGYLILRTLTEYERTESGKSWRKTPVSIVREVIPPEYYTNYISSIPFFNNWGDGASCRAKCEYTCAGYLPTQVVTIGPNHCKKIIAEFKFVNKRDMEERAGWREKTVIEKAERWSMEIYADLRRHMNGRRITLMTDDSGVTASATWDTGRKEWVD